MNLFKFTLLFVCFSYEINSVLNGVIQITSNNIDSILSGNEIVFINFYANWCRFSQILSPIYDQLADKISKEYPEKGLIVIGKVDADADALIATKYHVSKYPTLKLFRHGLLTKREYRGARQVDALFDYLHKQIQSPIIKLSTENDLLKFDSKKRSIIGYFNDQNSSNFQIFSKVANLLRDDCDFIELTEGQSNDFIYYRSSNNENVSYNGLLNNEESFYIWSNNKCIPLIKEITFENAEELTDEGLPFLILFHHQNDQQSILLFEKQISKELLHHKSSFNCLHADGSKFLHPLNHLGKTMNDLPVLVIDSFKHMFLFPDFKQISENGKLLAFVKDFLSGKLHDDFHKSVQVVSSPPESVFIRLTPSRRHKMRRHRQIALLGFPGVGKSSLAHHFVYKQFYNEYDPSIKTNLQHQCLINGEEYDLTIVDNAGSDQYTLNHIDFENSDAYILVYAIDDLQSFKMVSKIREKILSTSTITCIPIVLVGNKIDRNDERVVSVEEGRALANTWKVPFVEISAMDIKGVEEIFEKSIKTMDNIDSPENEITNSPRLSNGSITKQIKTSKIPSKQNKTCSIS